MIPFLFVDDSDHECGAMRDSCPEIEVVQTPSKPIDIPTCLDSISRLEVVSLTAEDLTKTELYAQQRRRRELEQSSKTNGGSPHDYLASLKMRMRLGFNDLSCLTRLTQLTQKTNQFNLTTRRYDEQQMQGFMMDTNSLVAHFSLSDAFGDSGIVGLAILRVKDLQEAEFDTFLMSCRVIGRNAEAAFLHALLRRLQDQKLDHVVANYSPTAKNALAKTFLTDQGFKQCMDGKYHRDLAQVPPLPESAFPIAVELVG